MMDAGSARGRGRCGGRVDPKEIADLYYQGWINKNGDLGGYGGGLWRKRALLELERGERTFAFSD